MSELLQVGQTFAGRYRIEKFLAQGGFGAVYVAEQTATELMVALKVLWPQVLNSADAVEKFKLEARIAGRVNSEHIVRVFDAGFDEASNMPFLVMELLKGDDLERVVHTRGPLPPSEAVLYLRQAASGLDRAHGYVDKDGRAAPIVHRDLKPENLFLMHREDGSPMVKILDFGIAKVLSQSTKMSQEVKGTPLYMAYEQASSGPITARTDIWALGLIAFYLLTGRAYWKAANMEEASLTQLFGEVLALPIVAPSERARELDFSPPWPAAFDEWFFRCVNRDPNGRFATAGEAASALARALGVADVVVLDRPSGVGDAVGAVTGGSGATLLSPELATTGAPLALGQTGVAVPAPSRKSAGPLVAAAIALVVLGGGGAVVATRGGGAPAAAEPASPAVPVVAQPSGPVVAPVIPAALPAPPAAVAPAPTASVAPAPDPAPAPTRTAPAAAAPRTPTAAPAAKPTAAPKPAAPRPDLYDDR